MYIVIKSIMKNILIHTCCADCLLNAIANLEEKNIISEETELTILFFNPNIHPRAEYIERLKAVQRIFPKIEKKFTSKLVIPDYSPKEYIKEIMKGSIVQGQRCKRCWEIRLGYSLTYAQENQIENITTTLLTSHYQERDTILETLEELAMRYNINIVQIDSHSNKKHSGFYKQNYCGCCFSLTEKMIE